MTEREAINRLNLVVGALFEHIKLTTNTQGLFVRTIDDDLSTIHEATKEGVCADNALGVRQGAV